MNVQPYKTDLSVKAFPNPSITGKVQFKISGLDAPEIISVLVYNVKGQVLYRNDTYQLTSDNVIKIYSFKNEAGEKLFIKIISKGRSVTSGFVSF